MLVNTMKAHTRNTKRSQNTFEPRANKRPNLSHTSRNVTHTIRTSHTQVEITFMLIYLGRKNLHTFPNFVLYGGS